MKEDRPFYVDLDVGNNASIYGKELRSVIMNVSKFSFFYRNYSE